MGLPRAIQNPAPTATRVQDATKPDINEQIRQQTEAGVAKAVFDREGIECRLRELDREWDTERLLQTNFGVVNVLAVTLGTLVARPWFLLAGVAAGFMAQHALQGWCPPVPVIRRLGFRTAREIAQERYALKAIRGDFEGVDAANPKKAMQAARSDRRG